MEDERRRGQLEELASNTEEVWGRHRANRDPAVSIYRRTLLKIVYDLNRKARRRCRKGLCNPDLREARAS